MCFLKPKVLFTLFIYFFLGEENSRVQAHMDTDEFSAHILTDEAEYNVEVNIFTAPVSFKPEYFLSFYN